MSDEIALNAMAITRIWRVWLETPSAGDLQALYRPALNDYGRNGTNTLFATWGIAISRLRRCHHSGEFLPFLRAIDAEVSPDLQARLINNMP